MGDRYHAFLQSLMAYTTIRVPADTRFSPEIMARSVVWLPVVGWIVGGMCALTTWGALRLFGPGVSVILGIIVGLLLTGAMHEDGLADVCDGFGGSRDRDATLRIMRDSSSGAFGTVAIAVAVAVKVALLMEIVGHGGTRFRWAQPVLVLPVAHALSRAAAASFMRTHDYVGGADSKAAILVHAMSSTRCAMAAAAGVIPLAVFATPRTAVTVLGAVTVGWLMLGRWFRRRIGGYTGDCLGATQQITEVLVYLAVAATWRG